MAMLRRMTSVEIPGFHVHQRFGVLLENVYEAGIQYEPVLDGLGPTFGKLPLAQGGQGGHVGEDALGLVERADQVLGLGQV